MPEQEPGRRSSEASMASSGLRLSSSSDSGESSHNRDEATSISDLGGADLGCAAWRSERRGRFLGWRYLVFLRRKSFKLMSLSVITVLVGCIELWYVEEWSWDVSLYVIAQVVTTIGYGDFHVKHPFSQIFMSLYVMCVLVLLAYSLNFFMLSILEGRNDHQRHRLKHFYENRLQIWADQIPGEISCCWAEAPADQLERKLWWSSFKLVLLTGGIVVLYILAGVFFFSHIEVHLGRHRDERLTLVESFYMSVITMTTVGFGDYTPKTMNGRLFAVVWMLSGVVFTGIFITAFQNFLFTAGDGIHVTRVAEAADFAREEFQAMDGLHGDRNGFITRGDFQTHILRKFNLVDHQTLALIDQMYDGFEHAGFRRRCTEEGEEEAKLCRAREQVSFDDVLEYTQDPMLYHSGTAPW